MILAKCPWKLERVGSGYVSIWMICYLAFGSRLVTCSSITFGGSCRVAKVFFQDEDYSDPRLPSFLRVADVKIQ